MRLSFGLLPFFVLAIRAQDTSISAVKRAFEAANIPADLTLAFNPTALFEVSLPQSSGRPITIHAGEQLPRNSTAGPPTFRAVGARGSGPFVVTMVDPDVPTPQMPTRAQTRHFLGGDFHLDARTGLLTNSTPAISEYFQPSPPAGSDAHRYILFLWNQPAGFEELAHQIVLPTTPREMFNISVFAQEVGLGTPIAGTFMLVAPDATA